MTMGRSKPSFEPRYLTVSAGVMFLGCAAGWRLHWHENLCFAAMIGFLLLACLSAQWNGRVQRQRDLRAIWDDPPSRMRTGEELEAVLARLRRKGMIPTQGPAPRGFATVAAPDAAWFFARYQELDLADLEVTIERPTLDQRFMGGPLIRLGRDGEGTLWIHETRGTIWSNYSPESWDQGVPHKIADSLCNLFEGFAGPPESVKSE